jgi:gamma-glutamyltranspeptidase/glutathione hydrolase
MKAKRDHCPGFVGGLVAVLMAANLTLFNQADVAEGQRGMVATVHPLATQAGLQALQRGGNAIDAAVAVALTLGVVDGHNSGIGGGCLMLIRLANGNPVVIDGRETAPLGAKRDMYLRKNRADPKLSQTGALSVGVPGALMAYAHAVSTYGRLKLSDHLLAASRIADIGFQVDADYAKRLEEHASELSLFEPTRAIFLRPDGTPRRAGEVLRQPELANTYRLIATNGIAWFYLGPFAVAASDWIVRNGGILTVDDFAVYQARLREPVLSAYRGYTIMGFPPPSSGGVHVAQILNILEGFDLAKIRASNSVDAVHITSEAMKLAFADRAYWLGDPDYVKVPRGIISKQYATNLAKIIRTDRAMAVPRHGIPPAAQQDFFKQHTTHFSTADAAGNWVACTATINTSFGSKIVIPGTGVLLNNEMDDFSIQPGVSNYFGLVGGEANAIAPRKRPLSSMSPTIILKGGQPVLALGAAGGPTIISQVVLAIINTIDFGMDLPTAILQPRFHHQWVPNELKVERGIGDAAIGDLEKRGHKVTPVDSFGVLQAIGRRSTGPGFIGASDPRVSGNAAGW